MVAVVLDANVIQQDWLCTGLRFGLLRHSRFYPPLAVYVPAVVLEELVANHDREVQQTLLASAAADRKLRRLGVEAGPGNVIGFDYRQYLLQRFDEVLAITVLDWPTVDHAALVARAVSRTAPFDSKGGGYRDALVWADAVGLAASGQEVCLVTQDRAFGTSGVLHPDLAAEADALPGKIVLVDDFGTWLLDRLPWKAVALEDAVNRSRDEEFGEWFMASDFQADLMPAAEGLSLPAPAYALDIGDVEWDGYLARAGERGTDDGLIVVEYDIGQTVDFEVELPAGVPIDDAWQLQPTHLPGRVRARGTVNMIVRVAVLFDAEHWSVEEVAWRRADGLAPGPGLAVLDHRQGGLF